MPGADLGGIFVKGGLTALVVFEGLEQVGQVGGEVGVGGEAGGGGAEEGEGVYDEEGGEGAVGGFGSEVVEDGRGDAGDFFFECGAKD